MRLIAKCEVESPNLRLVRRFVSTFGAESYVEHLSVVDCVLSPSPFYHQFQHKLPNHTVHNIADGYLFPEVQVELLLLDDCVLSGCNLCGLIDELLCDPDAKRHPVHLTVMTSITTAAGQEQIRELAVPFTLSQKFFHEYLVAPFQPPPYLTQKEARSFLDEFSPNWTQWAYPVHLEYKIANQFGSFPNVYHACRDPPVKLYPSGK